MNKNIIPDYVDEVLKKIVDVSKPVSIFLYGSMARDDFENDSDYEIGVVYKRDEKMSRSQLKELNGYENIKIYPFVYEDLKTGEIDTPFPKAIYLKTLVEESVCLYGDELSKIIKPVDVSRSDLFEAIGFCLGRAYAAVISSRQNDIEAVRDHFTKSAFYGLQLLIFIKTEKLFFSYKKIEELAKEYVTIEYEDLIKQVVGVRKGEIVLENSYLYKNINFLNKVVLKAIKDFKQF